ncbi:hypothetical protein CEXT_600371 [Caerostris extrusa]|uniref:Uncharacterized protein n=1 Tax=Caerostris extrusa TaxID=172846 RepID=A0AAV4QFY8_CAEEX|nr:hypothetical protein CEXT_600371 [Caerostris extrusa]
MEKWKKYLNGYPVYGKNLYGSSGSNMELVVNHSMAVESEIVYRSHNSLYFSRYSLHPHTQFCATSTDEDGTPVGLMRTAHRRVLSEQFVLLRLGIGLALVPF